MDLAELEALGLYDPQSPTAADRARLLSYLTRTGFTTDEMLAAEQQGRLFALAGDRILLPPPTFTAAEVSEQAGIPEADVRDIWRALGLLDRTDGALLASNIEVTAIAAFRPIWTLLGLDYTMSLARLVSRSMDAVAEAISSGVRTLPVASIATHTSEVAVSRAYAERMTFTPLFAEAFDPVLRHRGVITRQRFEQAHSYDVAAQGRVRLSVAFVDLSGFTSLSGQLDLDQLSGLLNAFEDRVTAATISGGGRVVKFIGDAAMLVGSDAATLTQVVMDIVRDPIAAGGASVPARGGVDQGQLLARDGDYFGNPVNLASRLESIAEPGTVLVTASVADELTAAGVASTPQGARPIRGLSASVEVHQVDRG